MIKKVTSRIAMLKILKKHGFYLLSVGKHEKWTNGDRVVMVSKKQKRFSMYIANETFKQAGIKCL